MSNIPDSLEGCTEEELATHKHSFLCVGLGLGDRWSDATPFDAQGNLVKEGRLPTTPRALGRELSSLMASGAATEVGSYSRSVAPPALARHSLSSMTITNCGEHGPMRASP